MFILYAYIYVVYIRENLWREQNYLVDKIRTKVKTESDINIIRTDLYAKKSSLFKVFFRDDRMLVVVMVYSAWFALLLRSQFTAPPFRLRSGSEVLSRCPVFGFDISCVALVDVVVVTAARLLFAFDTCAWKMLRTMRFYSKISYKFVIESLREWLNVYVIFIQLRILYTFALDCRWNTNTRHKSEHDKKET